MGKRGHRYTKAQKAQIKANIIEALQKSGGIIGSACKACSVSRQTILDWRKEDPEFAKACDETLEIALDLAESALLRNIQAGDTKAIKFYLLCKGKSRGYDLHQEIDINATVTRPRVVFEDEEEDGNAVQD